MLQTPSALGTVRRRYRLFGLLLICLLASVASLYFSGGRASATNSAVSYANNHWNWTYYDPNNHSTVQQGDPQPNFQCAEFVARALSTESLMPGLTSDSAQTGTGIYNYYTYKGQYDLLLITPTSGYKTLLDYLKDYGMVTDINHDLSQADPGDMVVFYDSSGTARHTVLITSVGSSTSSTYADGHNNAAYQIPLSNEISGFASYKIWHVTKQANACPASLSQGDSGTWVAVLKYVLNAYEYNYAFSTSSPDRWSYPLDPTNTTFTANTQNAVVDFQYWVGLGSSGGGVVGDRTWSALGFCESYTPPFPPGILGDDTGNMSETPCPAGLGLNDSGVWVKALQMRLNQAFYYGMYANSPDNFRPYLFIDGQYGSLTDNAVTDYQLGVGISGGGGGVGNRTWSELGMCY